VKRRTAGATVRLRAASTWLVSVIACPIGYGLTSSISDKTSWEQICRW
jgi:hypothetical protein